MKCVYSIAPCARLHLHVPGVTEGRRSVFKAHFAGHPIKRGRTEGVRGHTWNRANGTPRRGGGVRKTYNPPPPKKKGLVCWTV